MGNEPSSQSGDEVLPQMVLYLDTLMLWSGHRMPRSSDDKTVTVRDSPSDLTIDGETLFAQVSIDGREVEDGRVDSFPSHPIVINPHRLSSELQIKFFLGTPPQNWNTASVDGTILSSRLVPYSVVSAQMSNLYMFGAPLFSSTWIGLVKMEPHFGQDVPTSFFEAVLRAHLPDPDVPKVKVTVFKPSPLDMLQKANAKDPRSWQPKHDVLLPWGGGGETGLDACVESGGAIPEASAAQVEGLIKCVQQSNNIVNRLQEATKGSSANRTSVNDDRIAITSLNRQIRDIKYSINMVEQQWSAQGLEDEYSKLRLEIDQVNERHYEEVKLTTDRHMNSLKSEDSEIKRYQDVAEQRALDLSKEHDLKMHQYSRSIEDMAQKLDNEISSARWQWERSAAGELAAVTEEGKNSLSKVQSDGAARLASQRESCETEARLLRVEVDTLQESLRDRGGAMECYEAEFNKSSQELTALKAEYKASSEAADEAVRHEMEGLQTETYKAEAARFAEIEKLRAELLNMQKRRVELLEETEEHRTEDIASISNANKRDIQEEVCVADAKIEELTLRHEQALEQERQKWQTKCFGHERQLAELRVNADLQRADKNEKVEILESLEKEASVIEAEVSELRNQHGELTADIERASGGLSTRLKVAQDEAAKKLSDLENSMSEWRSEEASEWERVNSDRARELSQHQVEQATLKKELEMQREEASKRYSELQNAWERKCEASTQAANTAKESCKHAEDAAAKALVERRLEIQQRLESTQSIWLSELEALESELSSVSKSTQEEAARLSVNLQNRRSSLSKRISDIADEGNLHLESRRQFLEIECGNRLADLKRELEQALSEKNSAIDTQLRDHELSLVPLQAELEALRSTSTHLPEASRENRSLKHDLANERALLDLATSAHSDAEAMLQSRTAAIQKIQTEVIAMQVELSRAQERLEGEKGDVEKAKHTYSASLEHIKRERERADAAKERNIGDLKQRLVVQKLEFQATRAARINDVEAKCLDEKSSLENKLNSLQLELEEGRQSGERALKLLQEKIEGDLEVELFYKARIADEMREAQRSLEELRSEVEESEKAELAEQRASIAVVQENGKKELTRLMNATNAEIQSMADIQQTAFGKLQAAHEAERKRSKELLEEQEAKIEALRQQHTKAEVDVEKMSDAVITLQKEINAAHDKHASDMQNVTADQESELRKARKKAADLSSQLQIYGDTEEQTLTQQLRAVQMEVELVRSNTKTLRLEGERQKVKNEQAVEKSRQEIKRLQDKIESTSTTIGVERARNADTEGRQEQETKSHNESYENKKLSCQKDQERLEQKLVELRQELAAMQERLNAALADTEAQEKQFGHQIQMEVEEQNRGFQQLRREQEAQHQKDCEVQEGEQRQARDAQRSKQQQELDRYQGEMAELSTQVEGMKDAPAKIELAKKELLQLEEQCASLKNCIKSSAMLQVERREAEARRLETLHASELEETHSQFSQLLAKSRRDADAAQKQLEDELHEKRNDFNRKAAKMRSSIETLKEKQEKSQADFERQLNKDLKELQSEQNARNERLREEVQAARIECDMQRAAKSGREAEFRECLDEQLNAARSAADDKVNAAYKKEKEAVEADFAGHRTAMAEKVRIAKEASVVLKEMLEKSMHDFGARLEREIASENEKAQIERANSTIRQRELEERLARVQVQLATMQRNMDEKTRIHEIKLQDKSRTEQKEFEKARKHLREQQAGSISELSEAQKNSQDALRRMQDECFGTIDSVRQQATGQCDRRIRDATAKFRTDLWQSQQNYNVWQKRLDKVLREFEQVGCAESIFDKLITHPCDFLYNRLLLRMFRALLEEKHSVWSEEELTRLFDSLPKADEGGRHVELSKGGFREVVYGSLCFNRKFDLKKFIHSLEQAYTGNITVDDFETRLQANLSLGKGTIAQIAKFVDAAANVAASAGGPKPQQGILQEDDLAALLDHPQVRKAFESDVGFGNDSARSSRIPTFEMRRTSVPSSNELRRSGSKTTMSSRPPAEDPADGGEELMSKIPPRFTRISQSSQSSSRFAPRLGARRKSEPKLEPAPPSISPSFTSLLGETEETDKVPEIDSSQANERSVYNGEPRWV